MGYCANIHGLVIVPTQTVWCKTISDLRGWATPARINRIVCEHIIHLQLLQRRSGCCRSILREKKISKGMNKIKITRRPTDLIVIILCWLLGKVQRVFASFESNCLLMFVFMVLCCRYIHIIYIIYRRIILFLIFQAYWSRASW